LIVAGEEGEETLCLASVDTTFESGLSINQDSMSLRINNADLPYDVADIDGAVGFALNGDTTGNCPAVPGLGFGVAVTLL